MIPEFESNGNLPAGIWVAAWEESSARFGYNPQRESLLGLAAGLEALRVAGCRVVYIDGSFVTRKNFVRDYDLCYEIGSMNYDLLDNALKDISRKRIAHHKKFGGEFFPAQSMADIAGRTYLEYFQMDKSTGKAKGIVKIELEAA